MACLDIDSPQLFSCRQSYDGTFNLQFEENSNPDEFLTEPDASTSSLSNTINVPKPPTLPTASFRKTCIFNGLTGCYCVPYETRHAWDKLFDEGYRADVRVLTDDDGVFLAHSNVLGISSSVIRSMLDGTKVQGSFLCIKIHGVPSEAARSFIRFLYSSCYDSEDMKRFVLHLLVLSHSFTIPSLKRACVSQLEGGLLTTDNVVDVLQLARQCDAPRLSIMCTRMIIKEFRTISVSEGWKVMKHANPSLEQELLESLVEADSKQQERLKKVEERKVYMQLYEAMEAVVHICRDGCRTIGPRDKMLNESQGTCKYSACKVLESLLRHFSGCKARVPGGCQHCKRMWQLLELHSRMCVEPDLCKVPLCRHFKDKVKQQNKKEAKKWTLLVRRVTAAKGTISSTKPEILEVYVGMDNVIVDENIDVEGKAQGGDVVVEESNDGELKAEVGEEVALKETTGSIIVEENTEAELTTQVLEEDTSKEIVGSIIDDENTDGKHLAQVGEEEVTKETTGHAIVEESSDVERTTPVGEEALKEKMDNDIVDGSVAQVGEESSRETVCNVMVIEHKYRHKAHVSEEVLNKMVGNDIVEENVDGKYKTQVGEKEMLNEAVGSVIFEESSDGENKAQVGKEEVLNETMGNIFGKKITDGEHMAQARGAEALNETTGNVIAKGSTVAEYMAQVEAEEVLNGTVGNVNFEESTDGEHKAEVRKETTLNETVGDIIAKESEGKGEVREEAAVNETMDYIDEGTDLEHMAYIGEEEANERIDSFMVKGSTDGKYKAHAIKKETLSETEKQAMQSMASGATTIPLMENHQYVSYHWPSLNKSNFSISDLVWGKVKSHPWWPGQVFDPSDATKLAMKYQKKDSFLIGYFGDKTFAWCDESQLKPFHSYFSQLEKQCSSDTFVKAIHDILTEVARRVELGMACSCLSEEDFINVKYQKVENAGIRGGNINSIIDRPTVANYFQPARLLEYIQTLAQFPNGIVDRLDFVIAHSQLKAFYHSKGYLELPVFTVSGGLVECITENSPSDCKRTMEDITQRTMEDISVHCTHIPSDSISVKGKSRSEKSSFNKQEQGFMDDDKQKSISKLSEVRTGLHLENGAKRTFAVKDAKKPVSSSSGKKHIIVRSDTVDSGRCKKRMMDSFDDTELKSPSSTVTSSFKIGEFIRRAASQLTGGPPIVKCQADALQKCGPQAEHKKDDIANFDVFPASPMGNQDTNLSFIVEDNSTDELLSQLCLAARNPMDEISFVPAIVAFFTGFRNYCVPSSSEDNGHVEEHVEKHKRGRPRKVIAQLASSDIGSSEDDKHVEKRKRGMLTDVISQLASPDISSEEEKPIVEKRKRGRPRKNPQPDSSDSYEVKKPVQKPQRGRPRGRPKKVDTHLAFPDYSSSENKRTNEKRKRGRPRKVNTEIVHSDMPTPENMKDPYWSDMDFQHKSNDKGHIQYQRKRRKSIGEQSLSLPANPVQEIEQQLQLIAMNPNLKLTFIEERSIVSVEEKIVDECMPTSLILSFNNASSVPSETDLIRIFSRHGPLKETETYVMRKTNRAKVVFKRRVDAEAAFTSAGKYSIFGPGLLSYQLKPWTPMSTLQGTLQDTQDTASTLTPQGTLDTSSILTLQDTHDEAPIATQENPDVVSIKTPPGNHDTTLIPTPQDNYGTPFTAMPLDTHDLGSITTVQDNPDLAPITMVLDNDDAAVIITPQYKCDEPTARGTLEFSELAEAVIVSDAMQNEAEHVESSPYDKQYPVSIRSQQGNQNVVLVALPLDASDLAPTSVHDNMGAAPITIVPENHDASGVMPLQEKCAVGPSVGSMFKLSAQAEDVIASNTKHVEAEGNESSSLNDNSDSALLATPQESQVSVLVVSPPSSTQDKLNAAPIIMGQNNSDAASINRPTTIGNNLELSGKAEDVISSDTIQVEAENKGSSPNDKHDPTPISTCKENQDACHVASAIDERYLTPICTQDVDAASISMELDRHNATSIITLHRCTEGATGGSELYLSEQAEAVIVSDFVQVEAVDKESTPPHCSDCSHDSAVIAAGPEQYQEAIHIASRLDEHDLKAHNDTQDNLDTTPIAVVQDYHNAASIIAPQDKCDAGRAVENNLERSELIASLPQDNRDAAPVAPAQDYHDAVSIAAHLDHYDTKPIGKRVNHHEAFVATPQDNHDLAQISTVHDCHDLAPIAAEQDSPQAVAFISLQEKQDAGHTTGSNSKPSEQAEDVITSDTIVAANDHDPEQPEDAIMPDTIQVEAEGKKSLPENNNDPAVSASEQKQDTESIHSRPSTTEDNLDTSPISMPLDNHDPEPVSTAQNNHDEVSITAVPNHPVAPTTTSQDQLHATSIATPDDKHDLAPITQADGSHGLPPIPMVKDNHDSATTVALEDK